MTTLEQCSGGYVRVTFAEKPDRAILDALRAAGFWWGKGSWAGKSEQLPQCVKELTQGTGETTPEPVTQEPKLIKGCPRDKWDEVQAIQDQPFIYIQSNGSRWAGEEEGDIAELAEMLRKHTLRPDGFTQYSVNPCAGVEDPNRRGHYIDGPRLYRVDGVYDFSGNFLEYSHVFSIQTNHKPTIDLLVSLIDANTQSEAYQAEVKTRREAEEKKRVGNMNKQDSFWMVP